LVTDFLFTSFWEEKLLKKLKTSIVLKVIESIGMNGKFNQKGGWLCLHFSIDRNQLLEDFDGLLNHGFFESQMDQMLSQIEKHHLFKLSDRHSPTQDYLLSWINSEKVGVVSRYQAQITSRPHFVLHISAQRLQNIQGLPSWMKEVGEIIEGKRIPKGKEKDKWFHEKKLSYGLQRLYKEKKVGFTS